MRAAWLFALLALVLAPSGAARTPFIIPQASHSAALQFAAVYASAIPETGPPVFDFSQTEAPRISLDHVEAFLPGACEDAETEGCRATRSVFCSAQRQGERFVASGLMVRVRAGDSPARCYLITTHHSFAGAAGQQCRAARTHDLTQAPGGARFSWAALTARPPGSRTRTRWREDGLSLPRGGATLGPYDLTSEDDDFTRVLMSEGAACEAEDAVDYAPAAPVEDPATCDDIEWVGSFLGVRRYARFPGGEEALRVFRFGRVDFSEQRNRARRFIDHRFPSWEGISGFAALCRRAQRVTPLCVHAKGDAITRFQRERGRNKRIIIGDDTATGNGCVGMRTIFPDE